MAHDSPDSAPKPPPLEIHPEARVSPDAVLIPSVRGTRIVIGPETILEPYCLIKAVGGSGDVVIGRHCVINPYCVLYSGNGITLGDGVLVAPGAAIVPTNHAYPRRDLFVYEQGFQPSRGGAILEDDVWVGANCVILDGARVGRGAVLAAGSVVNGPVPEYEIWGGSPARKIGERP